MYVICVMKLFSETLQNSYYSPNLHIIGTLIFVSESCIFACKLQYQQEQNDFLKL
jgi:hypothetical protein